MAKEQKKNLPFNKPEPTNVMDTKQLAKSLEFQEKARRLIKRFEEAKNKRAQYVQIWQEVANYVLPHRGGFYDIAPNSGAISMYDKNVEIYDDTATNALVKAASALYSYTANPATQWFEFTLISLPNKKKKNQATINKLLQSFDVQNYLRDTSDVVCSYINGNIASPYHGFCQELLAFATSAFLIIEDFSDQLLVIQPIAAKDFYVLNNIYGGVGEVYRTVILTNEEAFSLFGQNLDQSVLDDVVNNPLKERIYIHAVLPRPIYDPKKKDVLNMPIASYWLDYSSKKLLLESGYEEFPYAVGRVNVPAGAVYGFSPAMSIRHTIKSLNKLVKQKLNAGDLALTPAMNVPIDTYINPLSMKPAALNYHEMDAQRVAEPMHTIGNFEINIDTIKDAREQVRQGLMIDLIEQLLQMKLMSSWEGNLERDALKPMVMRVFRILERRGGILPEPPTELQAAFKEGIGLSLNFLSPLAKAQRHFDVAATERVIGMGAQLAQVGGMDIVDIEKAMRTYADLIGAPSKILYTEKETRRRRQEAEALARQQQEQQAMLAQAQMIQSGVQSVKDAAQADQYQAQAQNIQQGGIPA